MIKNLDSINDLLTEEQKKINLELINESCQRLAAFSSKLNFSEKNKDDFDVYMKYIQKELKFIIELENTIMNLKNN